MKKVFFLFTVIIITSCNEQLNCDGYKYEDPICLPGFGFEEVDTLKIRLYKKDQAFKNCIDSFFLFHNGGTYSYPQGISITPQPPVPTDCDWEIEFNDTSIYRVTNIKMGATPEVTMFENRYRCNLISYNLNDSVMLRKNITISAEHRRIRRGRVR